MSSAIKYLLLQKSELRYEVAIRGETPSDNVEGLRRQVNKLTQLYPADEILDSVFEFKEDANGCLETLTKIKTNIETLKISYNEALFNRTLSWLNHLSHRILRTERPEKPEDIALFDRIQKQFNLYNAALAEHLKTTEPKASTSTSENYATDKVDTDTPTSGINVAVTCSRENSYDFSKLHYNGVSCVRSFIQKIEEFRVSKGVPESKMLSSAGDIFTEGALHWYRSIRGSIYDWHTLLEQLRESFDLPDYDYRMSAEIRNRTQGDEESITVYLAIMDGMFSRLSGPLTEEAKLEIILHNIHPRYTVSIAGNPNIETIKDLKSICKNYERIKAFSDNYREPTSNAASLLAPEFCYHSQKRRDTRPFFNNNPSMQTKHYNKPDSQNYKLSEVSTSAVATPFCMRCRVNTHSMRDCTAERTIFCFGCGEKGVRKPECPKCNKPKHKVEPSKN